MLQICTRYNVFKNACYKYARASFNVTINYAASVILAFYLKM